MSFMPRSHANKASVLYQLQAMKPQVPALAMTGGIPPPHYQQQFPMTVESPPLPTFPYAAGVSAYVTPTIVEQESRNRKKIEYQKKAEILDGNDSILSK